MNILLDTHIIIWSLVEPEKLSADALRLIGDMDNSIYYSSVSIWEIAIKNLANPEKVPISSEQIVRFCDEAGYKRLAMVNEHAFMLKMLHRKPESPPHKDPFDRMLIAQSKVEDMIFLTHDGLLKDYDESCVYIV